MRFHWKLLGTFIVKWGKNWPAMVIDDFFSVRRRKGKKSRKSSTYLRPGNERLFPPRFRVRNFKGANRQRPSSELICLFLSSDTHYILHTLYLAIYLHSSRQVCTFCQLEKTMANIKARLKSIYQGQNLLTRDAIVPTWCKLKFTWKINARDGARSRISNLESRWQPRGMSIM